VVELSGGAAHQNLSKADYETLPTHHALSKTVVTSEFQANLEAENFDNNGNGILGFAADTGVLLYSASGNFSADAQELLEIGGLEGANFVPMQQINVI